MLVVGGAAPASASDRYDYRGRGDYRGRYDYHDRHHSNSSEDTARVATYALGGLAAYGLATHNTTLGLLGAGVGVLAYSKWKGEERDRHRDYGWDRHDRGHGGWRR